MLPNVDRHFAVARAEALPKHAGREGVGTPRAAALLFHPTSIGSQPCGYKALDKMKPKGYYMTMPARQKDRPTRSARILPRPASLPKVLAGSKYTLGAVLAPEGNMNTNADISREISLTHQYFNGWAQFGAEHWVRKTGKNWWAVTYMGNRFPMPFKTKKEATDMVDVHVGEAVNRRRELEAR